MNEEAREALRAAGLKGTKQAYGVLQDSDGGVCAWGVLIVLGKIPAWASKPINGCHLCGATKQTWHTGRPIAREGALLVHLNNDHQLDFLGIAEKMPQEEIA